jgi:DNA-binding NarL/FixJ family response regulator
VVDDEPDMRFILRDFLARDPRFEVVGEADDGPVAIEACRDLKPDVVVLDVRMPTMDGMTAAPLIRDAAPQTAIALFTAFAETIDREAVRELDAALVDKGAPLPWVADHLADLAAHGGAQTTSL